MSEDKLDLILQRLDRIEADMTELKGDVKELRSSVTELSGDVREIKGILQGAGLPNINLRIGIATVGSAGMVAFFLMLVQQWME